MLAPITWRTPPRNYGPWEQVASVITEALVQNGIDVTLFATGDSVTKAKLQYVCDAPLAEQPAHAKAMECLHISNLMEQSGNFDIIHNHLDFLPLTYTHLIQTPVITTIHGFSSPDIVPVYKKYNDRGFYVSISESDRHPDLKYIGTVYNGINELQFDYGTGEKDFLLYFGRIHPDKGTHEAINIAYKAKKNLVLCGLIQDQAYFDEKVLPYLSEPTVSYLGNVGPDQRNSLMGNALALLHPISFDEPFGLSVAEAMMCGTPVIAYMRGSMKELIIDGKTGFLVRNVEDAVTAITQIKQINRQACRAHALEKFGSQTMADRYLELYKKILF